MSTKLKLNDVAITVLEKRYLQKTKAGEIKETPEQLFRRVAKNIAQGEKLYTKDDKKVKQWEDTFYEMMVSLDFLPNSPTLFNAGLSLQQLAACFVLPIKDTLTNGTDGILDTSRNTAIIHATGGGTGFNFSELRPNGKLVSNSGGEASGPVSFMQMYDGVTNAIKAGGKRRGANIGVLRVDHPDIEEFISCKEKEGDIANFNISVGITDAFMEAVIAERSWDLLWKGKVIKTVDAKAIWDKLVHGAWSNGEPGILYLDAANDGNPTPSLGNYAATNPCGELFLLPNESCNLGSINLSNFFDEETCNVDYVRLREMVRKGVRFLDNVVDMNEPPLEAIKTLTRQLRRIGLGMMGFADLLILMKVRYGSEESFVIAEEISSFIKVEAYLYSEELAKEKGVFPQFEQEKSLKGTTPRRNVTLISIAPTGTISMIAGCSSGIEPVFAFDMKKNVLDSSLEMGHPLYAAWVKENPDQKDIPEYFIKSQDVNYIEHVQMQSTFQKYVDSSISKTINFGNEATKEEVAEAYMLAWKARCKGITVYRDGSRQTQILVSEKGAVKSSASSRPRRLKGITDKIKTGEGTAYITVNEKDGEPFELFIELGKSGKDSAANAEAIGRLASLCLRSGVRVENIIRQLDGITGDSPTWDNGKTVKSVADAVAKVLSNCTGLTDIKEKTIDHPICKECGSDHMQFSEGCFTCKECGASKCTG